MAHGKFATAINCMDGRAQVPVLNWLKDNFRVDYVDAITEPGVDKIVSRGLPATDSIKERLRISVTAHHSSVVAIAGHDDCAGNPVSADEHKRMIAESAAIARAWGFPVRVLGLWIDDKWQVNKIADLP